MVRAGLIRQLDHTAGLYMMLPLGLRVLDKVEAVVDAAMRRAGGNKLAMPILLPAALWKRTGRWDSAGEELFRLRDRRDGAFCLGPTHEEAFTELVASTVVSWRQLEGGGLRLYQTDRKYRDEVRPRFGLMRGREFVMKDMYSFDADVDAARAAYDEVSASYAAIFRAIFGNEGTGWSRVEADTGNIGGSLSHEYQVHADVGEDLVLHCPRCNHAANQEKMAAPLHNSAMQGHSTSEARHQDAVQTESRPRGEVVFRATLSSADAGAGAATFPIAVCGLPTGRQANALKIRAHLELEEEPTLVGEKAGVEEEDSQSTVVLHHGVDGDFLEAMPGDVCPACCAPADTTALESTRGIEVGHVFYLGDKYSAAMGARFTSKEGKEVNAEMGCYGIGVSRIAAAAVERDGGHDADGIIWPGAIAPFRVLVTAAGGPRKGPAKEWLARQAAVLCEDLVDTSPSVVGHDGDDLVLDDRERESVGVKLGEALLVGYPWVVVVGRDALPTDKAQWASVTELDRRVGTGEACAEVYERATKETTRVPLREVPQFLREHPRRAPSAGEAIQAALRQQHWG
jgi:prolyl-tRNA synthetase